VRKLFHSRRFIRPEIHVVPVFQSKYLEIMEAFHRSPFSSHLGTKKMFERSGE
jgi:hemoglobin-like flavoprotein